MKKKVQFEDLSDIIITMDQFIVEIRKLKKKWRVGDIASAFVSIAAQYVVAMDLDKDQFMYWCEFFYDHADKMIEEMN